MSIGSCRFAAEAIECLRKFPNAVIRCSNPNCFAEFALTHKGNIRSFEHWISGVPHCNVVSIDLERKKRCLRVASRNPRLNQEVLDKIQAEISSLGQEAQELEVG